MGGRSDTNRDAERRQQEEERRRTAALEQANQPSQSEQRFNRQQSEWDQWIQGKDYGTPPPDSFLNFDLYSTANQNKAREKYSNLEGIGAANYGKGTGKTGGAVEMARERNINQNALNTAGAYEQAVGAQDAYFKGAGPTYAGLQNSRNMGILGNISGMEQFYSGQRERTRPRSIWGDVLGGAFGLGSAFLGNPNTSF